MMPTVLWVLVLVLLICAIIGAPGIGPLQHTYGWGPSGIGFVLVIVLLVLLLR